uniref:Uncharacterized protein n=1 Tax=Setaria italica TaxID=4555 RepID=K3ZZH3_SETIT
MDLFKLDRERDQLSAAIGTAEHSGCVRGMSSILLWGKAFYNDQASYRKRDRYKKDLEEKMREITKQEFMEFLASQQLQTRADPTVFDGQRQTEPTMQLAHIGFVAPSSAGSIANVRYPVDDIQMDTPLTGHVFPKEPPLEYAWVQIVTVLDESCEIDIPTDEGIEVLEVYKFLNILKKKASSSDEKSVACGASWQKEKDENLNFFALDEIPENYEHDKPFLYRWDLLEGPWELNKLHGWIMKAMKQGIRAITARVSKKIFLGVLDYEIVIDFEDLHRLYRRQHLDVNLITVWCL